MTNKQKRLSGIENATFFIMRKSDKLQIKILAKDKELVNIDKSCQKNYYY